MTREGNIVPRNGFLLVGKCTGNTEEFSKNKQGAELLPPFFFLKQKLVLTRGPSQQLPFCNGSLHPEVPRGWGTEVNGATGSTVAKLLASEMGFGHHVAFNQHLGQTGFPKTAAAVGQYTCRPPRLHTSPSRHPLHNC